MVSCLTVTVMSVWLGWLAVSAPGEVRRQWLGLQTGFWEHGGCCLLLGTILVTREEHFHRSVRQIMSPLQPWHMSAVSTPSVGASSSDSVQCTRPSVSTSDGCWLGGAGGGAGEGEEGCGSWQPAPHLSDSVRLWTFLRIANTRYINRLRLFLVLQQNKF